MQGEFKILDGSGHTTIEWDTEDTTKPSPDQMEAEFNRLVKGGHLAFTERDGENVQITKFDPGDEVVTFSPAFQGG